MIFQFRKPGSEFGRCAAMGIGIFLQLALSAAVGLAQSAPPPTPGATSSPPSSKGAGAETQGAVIERLPLVLRDPRSYQTSLVLKPVTAIDLVAQVDGIVTSVQVQPNQNVVDQAEAVRLESAERQLEVERAKAAVKAAQAATGPQAADLVDVALLDVKIAEQRLAQTIVRIPFDGTITNIYVVPGQFVRAGDPLVRLADLRKLTVDLPVDRTQVKPGSNLEIKIEDQSASGLVNAVLPLAPRFEPLRELFLSIATAQVHLDNANGKFAEGQTVYSDVIPRAPVTEVPTQAVTNSPDGNRRVQVIREGFVRDVPVEMLGQAGNDYVFVTGRFGVTDELVVKSSKDLRDGMRVLPATAGVTDNSATGARSPQQSGNRTPGGF